MLKKTNGLTIFLTSLLLGGTFLSGIASAAYEGNPVKGAELFKQCAACHAVGEGAVSPVGPTLNHVFGRKAGALEEFTYSDAMKAKGADEGLLWHEKTMYIYLAGPDRYVPGTSMGFPGLRKEKEIKDLMAYLIQFSPAYEAGSEQEVAAEVASAATLPAAGGGDDAVETPEFTEETMQSSDAISTGGELWAKQCRHCHGNSAYPGKAPKLKPASYEPDFVFDRITNGFRKMPAWKTVFSLDERVAMVAYILSDQFSP